MPWQVDWIDETLGIYVTSISDPFAPEERDKYFTALFSFWDNAPGPLYGLFDVSAYASASELANLGDRRFMEMRRFTKKIEKIAMVYSHTNVFARMVANIGARMLGKPRWFKHFDNRAEAEAYLREVATAQKQVRV